MTDLWQIFEWGVLIETEKFGQIHIPRWEMYKIHYLFVKIEVMMNDKLMLKNCERISKLKEIVCVVVDLQESHMECEWSNVWAYIANLFKLVWVPKGDLVFSSTGKGLRKPKSTTRASLSSCVIHLLEFPNFFLDFFF